MNDPYLKQILVSDRQQSIREDVIRSRGQFSPSIKIPTRFFFQLFLRIIASFKLIYRPSPTFTKNLYTQKSSH